MFLGRIIAALALLSTSAIAQAEWREAQSKHFIMYSEGSEKSLREAITKLEKYHFLLQVMTKAKPVKDEPVKLRIFMMDNVDAVGNYVSGAAGFFSTSVNGPFAVSTRSDTGGTYGISAQKVLFHEYTHHFMFNYFPVNYPSWYEEGFADYLGTAQIKETDKSDIIDIGQVVENRYLSFQANDWLPLSKLLTAKNYSDVAGNVHLLYAEGWLLVHYLSNAPKRAGQLQTYLNMINAGKPYSEARDAAFGKDAKELDSELFKYSRRSRVDTIRLPFKKIDVGPIATRSLSPAEDALIDYDIKLNMGIPKAYIAKFVQDVRKDTSRYADDPYALSILVETERKAGNSAAAQAALDKWLTIQPDSALAKMHKSEMNAEALAAAKSTDKAAWQAARKLLSNTDGHLPRDPRILASYYNSFVKQGVLPPVGAQNSLMTALNLVPNNDDLRYQVAYDFEQRNMIEDAIKIIESAAYDLHPPKENEDPKKVKKREEQTEKYRDAGTEKRETALEMLTRLQKKLVDAGAAKTGS